HPLPRLGPAQLRGDRPPMMPLARRSCPGCRQRDAHIAAARQRVDALEAEVRDSRACLGQNASDSSLPRSANPPGAPTPPTTPRPGTRPAAQPGHPAPLRCPLPPERVSRVVPFVPTRCDRCHRPLPPLPGPDDPEPTWHQIAELPEVAAEVTEYQGHYRT